MRALGLAVDMPAKRRPALRAVLLEDAVPISTTPSLADIHVVEIFEVPTTVDDLASQMADLSKVVSGRIRSLEPDLVAVRRADQPPRAINTDGPRFRLLATGAVTAAARLLLTNTTLRTGKECASAYGSSKDVLDADATIFVSRSVYVEAAAAALAALVADRT